ncbi:hypothetical protein PTKIN_Ptkin01aG0380900 [Pterospermum kingtungense]
MIRGWQKGPPYVQGSLVGKLKVFGSAPNLMDHALPKKRKTCHSSDSIFHKQELNVQASEEVLPFQIPAPSYDKGRGTVNYETNIGCNAPPYFDHLIKGSDVIVIRETKKLLHEVERVIYGEGILPEQVEEAKLILKDHERSILSAIAKLCDVSDDDDSFDQMLYRYSCREVHENKRQLTTHTDYHLQAGRSGSYPRKKYPLKKRYPL